MSECVYCRMGAPDLCRCLKEPQSTVQPDELSQGQVITRAWLLLKQCEGESMEEDWPRVDAAYKILEKAAHPPKPPVQPDLLTEVANYMRDNFILGNPEREKFFSIGYKAGKDDAAKQIINKLREYVKDRGVGEEHLGRGSSTYNWGMHYISVLELLLPTISDVEDEAGK